MCLVFYISGHGFGHASRSIEVINVVAELLPDLRIVIRSAVAPWLIKRTVHRRVQLEPLECDTGVTQMDSLRLDEAATIRSARAFMASFPARVEAEVARLKVLEARAVVADIPPLGIAAAKAAGIPGIALGNFTWDWIYAAYPGGAEVSEAIGRAYADTTLALRLPMSGGFATMSSVLDLPFVARVSQREPAEVRDALGLPRDQRLALMSFGGYGLAGVDTGALARTRGYRILIPGDIDESQMYDRGFRYEDLVRAVDVVVSKPGYGIISECLANHTALLHTSRGHFLEYDVLVTAMPRFLKTAFIDQLDLLSGKWAPHLDALLAQSDPPEKPATNGAAVAVACIRELL